MKIAIGSDERTHLTDHLVWRLEEEGHDVSRFGALVTEGANWVDVGADVGRQVSGGHADLGILCCWTGTGVSIAANKVRGVRAALCNDGETARGARRWNDANVLCLSLRSTTEQVADEILRAWLETDPDPDERQNIARLHAFDGDRIT